MVAESITNDACKICHGSRAEHFDGEGKPITRHAYTEKEGELVTHEQQRKQQLAPQQPQLIRLGGASTNEATALNKLVEVLLEKGALTAPEALYVVGVGSKPNPPSGYADPNL